ncbi:hypothetical protein ElyMa_004208500 [Elysia marginata]|uniref:Acyl-ACP thioesterase-like C-terminal domain-containing protein n=1 Tax=Elysia marginata TaxID=1093978 RepID=A0AAV4GM48_9GAST|nr:hypothetical protein ElyMa_004208500 [Elysia marginata]
MAYTSTKVSPKLYDYSVCKSPLEIHSELVSIGRTSFGMTTSIFTEGIDEPLCENYVQPVFINSATRKPCQPPDWWTEKFTQGLEDRGSFRLSRHIIPESGILHRYQTKISASDLDAFWHVNWSNYLKFTYNAFVEYAISKHGPGNIAQAFRNSKQFSLLYLQEANLNDTLDIRLWKDPENTNLFKFQFLNDSDVICESQIELYPHSPGEL